MFYLILIVLLVVAVAGPSYWVKYIMEKYSQPHDRYAGTGAELARALLDQANLPQVRVEMTKLGDHYDPLEKVVRLAPDKLRSRHMKLAMPCRIGMVICL